MASRSRSNKPTTHTPQLSARSENLEDHEWIVVALNHQESDSLVNNSWKKPTCLMETYPQMAEEAVAWRVQTLHSALQSGGRQEQTRPPSNASLDEREIGISLGMVFPLFFAVLLGLPTKMVVAPLAVLLGFAILLDVWTVLCFFGLLSQDFVRSKSHLATGLYGVTTIGGTCMLGPPTFSSNSYVVIGFVFSLGMVFMKQSAMLWWTIPPTYFVVVFVFSMLHIYVSRFDGR